MLSGRIWRPKYAAMAVLIISHVRYGHHLPPIKEISGVLCSVRSHGVTNRQNQLSIEGFQRDRAIDFTTDFFTAVTLVIMVISSSNFQRGPIGCCEVFSPRSASIGRSVTPCERTEHRAWLTSLMGGS